MTAFVILEDNLPGRIAFTDFTGTLKQAKAHALANRFCTWSELRIYDTQGKTLATRFEGHWI